MNITIKEFQKVLQGLSGKEKVLCLDVRTLAEHVSERIPGVHNIPLRELEEHIGEIKLYDTVYLHCQSGKRSIEAQQVLKSHGVRAINVLGGASEWKELGLMMLRHKRGMPIMQQVLTIAGSLITLGTLGVWLISPWFLLLTGFVGAGLLFAGTTGHCLMAYLLGVMPWNRHAKPMQLPWEESTVCCSS